MSVIEDRPTLAGEAHLPHVLNDLLAHADANRADVLRARLAQELPVLHDRLSRLYSHHPDYALWLNRVLVQTVQTALNRPADLWALDLQREANLNWHLQGMLGYCAYTDKFAGNLAGVRQRIPHLQALGVTYLHLLPFLKPGTPPNDGGFAVASYDEVDPQLGTLADLQQLTRELRSAGISLCSDFVLNHVSHEHAWAAKARTGDPQYQSYFHWAKTPEEVASHEQHLVQIFPNTAPGNFTFIPEVKAWAWTTFYPYQWDLNYAQPAVFSEMAKSLLQLANHGVEAFRLDSTGFLWKRAGTNCMNQPEVHWLLQALRCLTNIAAPGTLLKAEAIMPTQDLPPYFGLGVTPGPECHVAYHSSLMSASWVALAEENTQLIQDVLAKTPTLPEGCTWMTYVRCHDDIGWNVLRPELDARGPDQRRRLLHASQFFAGQIQGSYAQGEAFQASDSHAVHGTNGMAAALVGLSTAATPEESLAATARLNLLQSLSLFVGGLPLIYMGDELGQGNTPAVELDARQGPDGRELHRPEFDEVLFAQRFDIRTLAGQIYTDLSAFVRARKLHAALSATHTLRLIPSSHPAVLVLQRGEQALGLFNFSRTKVTVDVSPDFSRGLKRMKNVLTQETVDVHAYTLTPYAATWLIAQDA